MTTRGSGRGAWAKSTWCLTLWLFGAAASRAQDDSPKPNAEAHAPLPSTEQLEADHARIGQIFIAPENVFATDTPEENKGLFRLANRLHIKTREETIRKQLLF